MKTFKWVSLKQEAEAVKACTRPSKLEPADRHHPPFSLLLIFFHLTHKQTKCRIFFFFFCYILFLEVCFTLPSFYPGLGIQLTSSLSAATTWKFTNTSFCRFQGWFYCSGSGSSISWMLTCTKLKQGCCLTGKHNLKLDKCW